MRTKKKVSLQTHTYNKKNKNKTKKKYRRSKSNSRSNIKAKANENTTNLIHKIEFNILLNIIIEYVLLLINNKVQKAQIKEKVIILLKELRNNNKLIKKNIKDNELNIIFNNLYKNIIILKKKQKNSKTCIPGSIEQPIEQPIELSKIKKHKVSKVVTHKYKGGFYFKNIEDKGDNPITGSDITKLLDEMQAFFYNAQYTDEGAFVKDSNILISMLRGDTESFKSFVTNSIIPRYYQVYPPFLKWDAIKKVFEDKKYEDLPDYLMAYQTYNRSQDEYLVEKGLKSPNVLNKDLYSGFFDKLAKSLDTNITKYQQARKTLQGQTTLNIPL